MIQDIEPYRLNNSFQNKRIKDNDAVISFSGREVLVERKDNNELHLPRFTDFSCYIESGELSLSDFQYVFEIGGCDYYIIIPKTINNMRKDNDKIVDTEPEKRFDCGKCFAYDNIRNMRQIVSKDISFAIMTAYHLYVWYRDNRFCGRCGGRVMHDDKERMLKCECCGNMIYPKIAPAVIAAVTDGDRILMTKYAPSREFQKYALIAGFTEIGETAEETVKREVMEEVGLSVKNIRYYKSQPWGIDSNLLMGFFAELDGDGTIKLDEDELSCAEWFKREEMPAHDDGISLTREMMGLFEDREKYRKFCERN